MKTQQLCLGAAVAVALSASIVCAPRASAMEAANVVRFHIPAQPLPSALLQFSDQAEVQIASEATGVAHGYSHGINGRMSVTEALARLLAGTGFTYVAVSDNTYAIRAGKVGEDAAAADPPPRARVPDPTVDQAVPPTATQQATAAPKKSKQLRKIIVTGSHIPQTSVATTQPIINITHQQIEASGFTSVGEILSNLVQGGASFGQTYLLHTGTVVGSSQINLKNLGAKRVLVLVDGHRWSTLLGGAVDLNSIPSSIIQRIQIDLNGASAIYGADAITGVINIITIKNFKGAEASAYLGGYYAHGDGGGWDGQTEKYSLTVGASGNRGGVLLSLGFRQIDPIWSDNRNITSAPVYGFPPVLGGAPFFNRTGGFLLKGPTNPNNDPCFGVAFPADACFGPWPNPHSYSRTSLKDNPVTTSYLITPSERYYGYAQGHYDLTNNVTFTSAMFYGSSSSSRKTGYQPLEFGAYGYWTENGLPIGISATAPGNPFGTDLIPALGYPSTNTTAAIWCSRYGTAPGGGCRANSDLLLQYTSGMPELGHRFLTYTANTWLWRSGFNGNFMFVGNEWKWNVSGSYSKVNGSLLFRNEQNTVHLQRALGPAKDCTGDCIPLNLFAGQAGFTKAAVKYLNTEWTNTTGFTQRDYTADLAGNFFNGWYAGPWGVAVGGEYLYQSGFFRPAVIDEESNVTGGGSHPTGGRVSTRAEYAELQIPFAHNLPGAKDISLDLANRWSQFRVKGITGSNAFSSSTGRVGLKWEPVKSLLLRGSWSQSFRAPSISELFSGQVETEYAGPDPCLNIGGGGAPPPDTFNCPIPSPSAPGGSPVKVLGGNPDLTPERAISRSMGLVWSPSLVSGLNFSADYYKIEIVNAVGAILPSTIVNGCYLANVHSYCNLITRVGPYIKTVDDFNLNTGSVKTDGWDLAFHYSLPVTPIGQFKLSYSTNFVKSFVKCNAVTLSTGIASSKCHELAGSRKDNIPKKRMNFRVNWAFGPWSATWRVELIGAIWEDCQNSAAASLDPTNSRDWCSNPNKQVGPDDHAGPNGGPSGQNHLGTTVYNDVQVSYNLAAWHTTFTVGVNNIFQRDPPVCMTCEELAPNMIFFYYRIPGRNVYARIQVKF